MGLGIGILIFVIGLAALVAGATSHGPQLYQGITGKKVSIQSNSYGLGSLGGGLLPSLPIP